MVATGRRRRRWRWRWAARRGSLRRRGAARRARCTRTRRQRAGALLTRPHLDGGAAATGQVRVGELDALDLAELARNVDRGRPRAFLEHDGRRHLELLVVAE